MPAYFEFHWRISGKEDGVAEDLFTSHAIDANSLQTEQWVKLGTNQVLEKPQDTQATHVWVAKIGNLAFDYKTQEKVNYLQWWILSKWFIWVENSKLRYKGGRQKRKKCFPHHKWALFCIYQCTYLYTLMNYFSLGLMKWYCCTFPLHYSFVAFVSPFPRGNSI